MKSFITWIILVHIGVTAGAMGEGRLTNNPGYSHHYLASALKEAFLVGRNTPAGASKLEDAIRNYEENSDNMALHAEAWCVVVTSPDKKPFITEQLLCSYSFSDTTNKTYHIVGIERSFKGETRWKFMLERMISDPPDDSEQGYKASMAVQIRNYACNVAFAGFVHDDESSIVNFIVFDGRDCLLELLAAGMTKTEIERSRTSEVDITKWRITPPPEGWEEGWGDIPEGLFLPPPKLPPR